MRVSQTKPLSWLEFQPSTSPSGRRLASASRSWFWDGDGAWLVVCSLALPDRLGPLVCLASEQAAGAGFCANRVNRD